MDGPAMLRDRPSMTNSTLVFDLDGTLYAAEEALERLKLREFVQWTTRKAGSWSQR
jgi:FMN phosphatase YigB (HAD superfamily)